MLKDTYFRALIKNWKDPELILVNASGMEGDMRMGLVVIVKGHFHHFNILLKKD